MTDIPLPTDPKAVPGAPTSVLNRRMPLSPPRERTTRKPSGLPSWPVLLLAGKQKAGKSFHAALAARSDLIGTTYWISFGEKDPDEYGALADFEIVPHDGSIDDAREAIRWAAAQPRVDGKPNLIVLDTATKLWDACKDLATFIAAQPNRNKRDSAGNLIVPSDIWNRVNAKWDRIVDALRSNDGPVIVTSRMDTATVFKDGKPTQEKAEKIKGKAQLPYDVDAIIEMPERGKATLTGARSTILRLPERMELKDFDTTGVDGLWRSLGLANTQTAPAVYSEAALADSDASEEGGGGR